MKNIRSKRTNRNVVYKLQTRSWHCFTANFTKCRAGSGDGVLAVCFYAFRVCNTNRTLRNERCGESERKFPNEPYKEIFKRYQGRMKSTKNTNVFLCYKQSQQRVSLQAPDQLHHLGAVAAVTRLVPFLVGKARPQDAVSWQLKNLQNSCFCTLSKIFKTHTLSCWPTLHSVCAHYWLVRSAFVDMITSDELDQTRFSSHNWGLIELDENRFRRNVKEGEKRRERRKRRKGERGE